MDPQCESIHCLIVSRRSCLMGIQESASLCLAPDGVHSQPVLIECLMILGEVFVPFEIYSESMNEKNYLKVSKFKESSS